MDTSVSPSSPSDGLTILQDQIRSLKCRNVEGKSFVPEGTLDQVLTTDTVQSAVYSYSRPEYRQSEIVRAVISGGRKVFAILVLMNKLDLIATFAESDTLQGANVDSKLPYELSALQSMVSSPEADDFYNTQWTFAVPHFRRGMGHLHLSDETIMPIMDIQIQGSGGFSDVSVLTFHPNHSDFAVSSSREGQPQQMATLETPDPGLAPRNPRAMRKRYQGSNFDLNFNREASVLSVLNRLEHPSIIQLLGSYRFQNAENLLLPPMSGDIHQLLAEAGSPSAFKSETYFLFALCGLSSAIETLHDHAFDAQGRKLIGLHMDIKPSNILVDEGRFVLADFALSELMVAPDGDKTHFKSGTIEYAAPECILEDFEKGLIRRSSDIWSFGCVIAEIATYIYSAESTYGVERFKLNRKHEVLNNTLTTYAFHAHSKPNPGVADWLAKLKAKATPVGIELVNLVIDMLQMEPASRPRAAHVTSRLRVLALSSQAQSTDEAYTKVAEILSNTTVVVYRIQFQRLMKITGLIDRNWQKSHIFESGVTFDDWKVSLRSIAEHLTALLVRPDLRDANLSRLSSLNDELTSALPSSLQVFLTLEETLPPKIDGKVDANARKRSYIQDWGSSGTTDTSSTLSKVSGWSRGQEGFMEHTLESSVERQDYFNLEDSLQEHEIGDDTQSVLSDQNDINSQKSSRRHPREVTAEDHLTILLAKHDDLCPLYEEALSKVGSGRFVNNFRRLLKSYYLDLLRNAETNLERATISLMKSRWSRTRIAQRIVDIHKPESESAREQIERHAEELKRRIPDLHDWLVETSLAAPVGPVEPAVNIDDGSDRDQSSDDENDTPGEEHAGDSDDVIALPHIKEMENFVMEGRAFQILVTNLRIFLLPAALRPLNRILMSIPLDRVWLSTEDDLSISNSLKTLVEGLTEKNWNWWPLRAKMRVLHKDQIRLHWKCHCDMHLWTELTKPHAEQLEKILRCRDEVTHGDHLCGPRRRSTGWNFATVIKGIKLAAVSASSPGGWYGSSSSASAMQINQATSPGQDRQAQERQTVPTAQRPTTSQHRATEINIEMPEIDQAFVLFGVKGPRRTLELAQIDTLRHGQDELLFWNIRKEYKKLRGALRYWFSIWRLSHCDFVKFARIRANRVIFRGRELPTDAIYDYNPRPPNAEYPPISPHEFELAFASCSSGCVFSLFHDCVEPPNGTFALERIPKRKKAIDLNEATLEHAWGIQAQYVISFVHMLFYHCLIFAATFGFWAWWLVKHPDDLQNAAVPLTTVAVLLSLFWGSAGILKVLREPT